MDKLLEMYNLLRLNQEDIENINRPITHKETETDLKSSNEQKSRTRWLHKQILSNMKRRANTHSSQTLPKNCTERNTHKLILQGHQHPHTKSVKRYHKKRKLQPNVTDSHRLKNPQQSSSKQNPATHWKGHCRDQVGLIPGMQGCFKIHKSISVIHHTERSNNKNHMIISVDAGKVLDKMKCQFMVKALQIVGTEETWKVKVFIVQSCSIHCEPMNSSSPGFSVCGILLARIVQWVAIPSPGDPPNPGTELRSPSLQADSLPSEPPWKPLEETYLNVIKAIYEKSTGNSILND